MTRDALVVGINTYPRLENLPKPARDAEAIAQLLEKYGEFRVRRLPEANLDAKLRVDSDALLLFNELEEAIANLFNPDGPHPPETALLFFAGHGLRKSRGGITEGFLATSDSDPSMGFRGLSLQWLRRLLQQSKVRQQIVWLDCCHSGELDNFDEADPGSLGQGRDRCFIAACRAFEFAYESLSGEHGVLTEFLLQGLDPNRNDEGIVTNNALVDFINQTFKGVPQAPICRISGDPITLTTRKLELVRPIQEGICPYRGLRYFDFNNEDAQYFYGRTALTDESIDKLGSSNFLAILGSSGSGKSSLVRAGLLHKLKLGQSLSGSDRWKIYPPLTPGEQERTPLQNLAWVFVEAEPELSLVERASQLKKAEELISMGVEGFKSLIAATQAPRMVLVVDQFEEIFTLCKDDSERQKFFDCLLGALEQSNGKLFLVLVMRADFLGKCAEREYSGLANYIANPKHQVLVKAMTVPELQEAITKPAQQVGLEVERGLVQQMIEDVLGSPGSLPLLQYTLTELWEQKLVNRLTLSEYNRLGGVKGSLQKQANQVFQDFPEAEKKVAKHIFLELTQLGEGTEDTRRRVLKNELVTTEYAEETVNLVLSKLVKARLVVTDKLLLRGETGDRVTVVDLAHEALIRHWSQLKAWLEENREMLRRKRQINLLARQWVENGKSHRYGDLLGGIRLNLAEDFFVKNLGELSSDAIELIQLSQEARDRQIQEKEERDRRELQLLQDRIEIESKANRKLRQRAIIASSLGILTGIALIVAIYMWLMANYREKTAKSVQLAIASEASLNVDSTRSLLLAIQANLIQDTPQAKLALWNAFKENHERFNLVGHEGSILYAEFDPKDGNRVLTVSSDGTARIWKLNNSENPLVLKGHKDIVVHGRFDPKNSNRVLTVSYDGTARVWDTNNIDNPILIVEDEGFVNYGSFDPNNSNRILTASTDGNTRIWDINNSSVLVTLKGHEGDVWMASFDPNNSNRVLTIGSDSTARVWNLKNPSNPLVLKGHEGDILYGSFDPKNSNRILTTSTDKTARVWNLSNPTQPLILNEHNGIVKMASFDPNNSNRVLTVSEDGTARVWDLSQPEKPIVLGGGAGKVVYGEFKPDNSNQVLTVSQDGKAQVWELKAKGQNAIVKNTLNGHQAGVNLGIFNPHNPNQILTVGKDAVGRIWDVSNQAFFELPENQGTIIYANFSIQDSKKLLTVNRDGVIQAWDIAQSKFTKKSSLQTGIDSLIYADFHPSNPSKIVTVNVNGIIQIWDINNQTNPVLELPETNDKAVAFKFDTKNPDNLLILNSNGVATIRNVKRTNEEPLIVSVYPNQISYGEFNPNNSNEILTSSNDGVVRFWNLEDTFEPLLEIPTTNRNILWYASFDPNNSNRIFAGGSDKIGRVWSLSKNVQDLTVLMGHEDTIVYGEFDRNNSNRILTASHDQTVRIWDLTIPNEPIIIKNFDSEVIYASFSSQDSNQVVTISKDGKAKVHITGGKKLLELAWNNLSRCLTKKELKTYNLDTNLISSLSEELALSYKSLFQLKYRPNCHNITSQNNEKGSFSFFNSPNIYKPITSQLWIHPGKT